MPRSRRLLSLPYPVGLTWHPKIYRARIAKMVESLEAEAARNRERTGASVVGVKAILACDPLHRPSYLARSPASRVHAATKAARKAFHEIYAAFVGAFREASERLRRGDRNASFPTGSFPPAYLSSPGSYPSPPALPPRS